MSTTIWIKLEIDGEPDESMDVIDDALDNGCMQDALAEYASDNGKDFGEITDAAAYFDAPPSLPARTLAAQIVQRSYSETECNTSEDAAELAKLVLARESKSAGWSECAECHRLVAFGHDGQPLAHDDNSGRRCGS